MVSDASNAASMRRVYVDSNARCLYVMSPVNNSPAWIIDWETGVPLTQRPIYVEQNSGCYYYMNDAGRPIWVIDPFTNKPMNSMQQIPAGVNGHGVESSAISSAPLQQQAYAQFSTSQDAGQQQHAYASQPASQSNDQKQDAYVSQPESQSDGQRLTLTGKKGSMAIDRRKPAIVGSVIFGCVALAVIFLIAIHVNSPASMNQGHTQSANVASQSLSDSNVASGGGGAVREAQTTKPDQIYLRSVRTREVNGANSHTYRYRYGDNGLPTDELCFDKDGGLSSVIKLSYVDGNVTSAVQYNVRQYDSVNETYKLDDEPMETVECSYTGGVISKRVDELHGRERSEVNYNSDGLPVSKVCYAWDTRSDSYELSFSYEYAYDSHGAIIKYAETQGKGQYATTQAEEYEPEYDSSGRIVKYDGDPGLLDNVIPRLPYYAMDGFDWGMLGYGGIECVSRFRFFDVGGAGYCIYTYDDKGNVVQKDGYYDKGTICYTLSFTFDANNNLTQVLENGYYSDGQHKDKEAYVLEMHELEGIDDDLPKEK